MEKAEIIKQIREVKVNPCYELTTESMEAIIEMSEDPFMVLRNSFLYGYYQGEIDKGQGG